ncbi:GntR family transcriptional regulator [Nocardioides exalbidus]|uniref:GntR family transcriptional regulator n=1 Tax=Nocardioides exalbidus TaxID=402596 RepID=UPI001C31B9CA|nr:GntR family transcriptional regulator [Nocardioides exalbidus]
MARRIDDGPRPKHVQLSDVLAELATRDLGPDAAIPSERDLMATYDVSRATVRKAIDSLVAGACSTGSRARAPSSRVPASRATCTWRRSPTTCAVAVSSPPRA